MPELQNGEVIALQTQTVRVKGPNGLEDTEETRVVIQQGGMTIYRPLEKCPPYIRVGDFVRWIGGSFENFEIIPRPSLKRPIRDLPSLPEGPSPTTK